MSGHKDEHKVGANGHRDDGVSHYPANAKDLASYVDARQALSQLPAPVLLQSGNPHERLYIAAFDGTGNDAVNDPEHITNVGRIRDQVRRLREQGQDTIAAGYVEGIGTQSNAAVRMFDGAVGFSYEERMERMYQLFTVQSKEWLRDDPDAQIRVADIGFSRGAEQAAGFARLVHERGIQDPDGAITVRDEHGKKVVQYTRPPLVAPGQTPQAVGLFDPVGTGEPRDHDRRLPPSVISGFQITAEDERRNLFKSTSIIDPGMTADGRFLNVMVGGAHSDVGGSYHLDGLSTRSGNLMADYINALSDRPFLEKRAEPSDPALNVVHRSEAGMFLYRIMPKVDRREDEGTVERLVPKSLAGKDEDHFNAQPRDERMAGGFQWRPVLIGPVAFEHGGKPAMAQETDSMHPSTRPGTIDSRATDPRAIDPSEVSHPDNAAYQSLHGMVEKMHAHNGIAADEGLNRQATLALLSAQKKDGLRPDGALNAAMSIDGVVLSQSTGQQPDAGGKYAILFQGDPSNPTVRTLAVPSRDLLQPAEQSMHEINRSNDQQQSRAHTQQAQPQPSVAQPSLESGNQQPVIGARSSL